MAIPTIKYRPSSPAGQCKSAGVPVVRQRASTTQLIITIKNGIATISGNAGTSNDAACAQQLLTRLNSVTRVINLASSATQKGNQ